MKRNSLFKFCLALATIFPLQSQTGLTQASPSDSLTVWLDYACFKFNPQEDSLTDPGQKLAYVEIYYALNRSQLTAVASDTDKIAILDLSMKIVDLDQQEIASQAWKVGCRLVPDDTSRASFIFYDLQALQLLPGRYNLNIFVTQPNSSQAGSKKISLSVPDFSDEEMKLSDIELALGAETDTSQNKFVKGGRLILPNPTQIYGATSPLLYFYAEVYNLKFDSAENSYNVSYTILDSTGDIQKEYPASKNKKPGSSTVILSGLNITTLSAGKYQLRIDLEDPATRTQVTAKKDFWVMDKTPVSRFSPESGPIPRNEQEAQLVRAELAYIATQDELRMYDQLNLTGKQGFLKEFWRKKDPDPQTPANEFKLQFYQRISEANQMFSSQSDDRQTGWRTEQGKIYVVYGRPDFIERHHYAREIKPWEKWIYNNLQGGTYFIFSDEEGYGVFRLVHSTVRGEKNDPNWERILQEIPED